MTGKSSLRALKDKGDTADAVHPDHEDEIDPEHPFAREMIIQSGEGKGDAADQLHDDKEHHASQHTFFITNSQRKLKLVTKNAVSPPLCSYGGMTADTVTETDASVHRLDGEDRIAVSLDTEEQVRLVCPTTSQCRRPMAR